MSKRKGDFRSKIDSILADDPATGGDSSTTGLDRMFGAESGRKGDGKSAGALDRMLAPTTETKLDEIEIVRLKIARGRRADADAELTDSIGRSGILQPLLLRASGSGFEVLDGGRRLAVAREKGLKTVPAVVRTISNAEAKAMAAERQALPAAAAKPAPVAKPAPARRAATAPRPARAAAARRGRPARAAAALGAGAAAGSAAGRTTATPARGAAAGTRAASSARAGAAKPRATTAKVRVAKPTAAKPAAARATAAAKPTAVKPAARVARVAPAAKPAAAKPAAAAAALAAPQAAAKAAPKVTAKKATAPKAPARRVAAKPTGLAAEIARTPVAPPPHSPKRRRW